MTLTHRAARPQPARAALLVAALVLPALLAGLPAQAQTAATDQVQVRSFQVQGNTLLDADAVQAALAPYTGARDLADLQKAAQAVQALYGQAGWAAVLVYLPPQPVADGVVTLNVVEGKLGRVLVQGNQRLSAERVRVALPSLVEGGTPRVRRIDAELQIANENPGRSMAVLLGPGTAPGEVQATVKVDEQPVHRFSASLDNSGNDRTGQYRLALGWQHADLTGHDDQFSLTLQTSPTEPSMVRVASAGYRWPLPGLRAAVDLFAAYSNVDGGTQKIGSGNQTADLSFAGAGRIAGARMVWYLPRLGEFDQRLTTGLETRAYLNDCSVAGLPGGACGAAGESVAVQPLTLEYAAQQGGAAPMLFTLGVSQNLALGGKHGAQADFDAVRPGAPRRYTVLRVGAQASMPVLEDLRIAGRLSLQHSGDALVSGEQFGLGGAQSVRGYEERELSGDSGWQLSLELISPRLGVQALPAATDLRLLAFADAGEVRNQGGLACRSGSSRCKAASVGVGLRLGWGPVQLRADVARALHDASGASTGTERGDWRGHVALSASF
jgi:hemolysin activation/secretion protein